MSMPTFPDGATDITQEQALNMILGSIAMEELALSHIMNAEAEKLQYLLGTLPGRCGGCATACELLEVNRSISELLENVMHNQMLLKGKLTKVLEAKEVFCPCPKPAEECCAEWCCKPCQICEPCGSCEPMRKKCIYHTSKCCSHSQGSPIPWIRISGCDEVSRQGCSPSTIYLSCNSTYIIGYTFQLNMRRKGKAMIALQTAKDGGYKTLALCEGSSQAAGMPLCLSSTSVLVPTGNQPPSPILFTLIEPDSVTIEQAVLSVIVL